MIDFKVVWPRRDNRTANIFYIYLTYKLCILFNLSKEEIAFLEREAQYHNLTVIPLVQTFGHLEVSIRDLHKLSFKYHLNMRNKSFIKHNLIKSICRVNCSSPNIARIFFH